MTDLCSDARKTTRFMEDFLAGLGRYRTAFNRLRRARAAARALGRLDDRLLADIGLVRDAPSGALRRLPESFSAAPVRLRR